MSSIYSMTGFGESESEWSSGAFTVQVRSVNHRYLDLVARLPKDLRQLEAAVKSETKSRLSRGRVEISVEELGAPGALRNRIDFEAAREIVAASEELGREGLALGKLSAHQLLTFPEVFGARGPVLSAAERDEREAALLDAVRSGLDNLVGSRAEEGGSLLLDLRKTLIEIKELVASASERASELAQELPQRYRERLQAVVDGLGGVAEGLDQQRVITEAGILAERLDVSEELERLAVHLATTSETLEEGGPCGKRLDFLAQEILRELNTVASKSRDSRLTAYTVDAKVHCERLREQVQNIE